MELGFDGETALVTASSRGLGLASATALAREGANVTICGRTADQLDDAQAHIEEHAPDGGDVLTRQADITDPDDIADFVATTAEAFGGLDHVVTSAGGPPSGSFHDMTDRDWYAAYDLLVMSVVRTVEEAYPHLDESDAGTITCITSTSVLEALDGLLLSNAVRRGVVGLVKTISREFAPSIRANVVAPGAHETERIEELVEAAIDRGEYDTYREGLDDWSSDIPLNRIGDPMELGNTVAYLASDRAGFINGATVPVDGGRTRS